MKILVLSDSHSALSFMRKCVDILRPDAVIHLGDYYDDGQAIREEYPDLPFYQVAGNCDKYRTRGHVPEILIDKVFGVEIYMTHGHLQHVKLSTTLLTNLARQCKCDAVVYGHTHVTDCRLEEDGLWVLNPGSCGYNGGSAGLIRVNDNKITSCRIIRGMDLEELI